MMMYFGTKFKIGLCAFWILILSLSIVGEEFFQTLDFQSLKNEVNSLDGEKVRIRGFLFKNGNQWVLSEEPNLRTCCIGSKEKVDRQVLLSGQFDEGLINHVVGIEGIIKKTQGTFNYQLENAKLLKSDKDGFGLLIAFCILCALIAIIYYRR